MKAKAVLYCESFARGLTLKACDIEVDDREVTIVVPCWLDDGTNLEVVQPFEFLSLLSIKWDDWITERLVSGRITERRYAHHDLIMRMAFADRNWFVAPISQKLLGATQ